MFTLKNIFSNKPSNIIIFSMRTIDRINFLIVFSFTVRLRLEFKTQLPVMFLRHALKIFIKIKLYLPWVFITIP